MTDSYIPMPAKSMIVEEIDSTYDKKSYVVQLGSGKRFEVNSLVASLINKIDGMRNITSITAEFNNENSKSYSAEDVKNVIEKVLLPKNIVVDETNENLDVEAPKRKSYMWFRFDFLREEFVMKIANVFKFVFSPFFLIPLGLLSVAVHFLYYNSVMDPTYIDPDVIFSAQFIIIFLLLNLDTVFHEFGHASSLRYYGQKPENIGLGIYMFMFVLYADVTNVWKLKRKQRIIVNLGGFIFESIILNILFGLYLLTNQTILLVAFLFIDIKILFGLNPFFRFDGYWIFNDLLGVTNLRDKSNQLLKYFANKLVFRSYKIPGFWNNINNRTKSLLVIYSFLSLLFFSWVGYELITVSYSFILNIDKQFLAFVSMVTSNFNVGRFFMTGSFLIGKIMMILFTLLTLLKIMRYTFSLYKK